MNPKLAAFVLTLALGLASLSAETLIWNNHAVGNWETGAQGSFASGVWQNGDSAIFNNPGAVRLESSIQANVITLNGPRMQFVSINWDNTVLQFNKLIMADDAVVDTVFPLNLTVTGQDAITNGTLKVRDPGVMSLNSVRSITGGTQQFGDQELGSNVIVSANVASAITGGSQNFTSPAGQLWAMVANSIDGGNIRLQVNSKLTVFADQATTKKTALTFANGGILELNGHNTTIGRLIGDSGLIQNTGNAAASLTVDFDNADLMYQGAISNGAHALNLVKAGTGTFTILHGVAYTGTTTVSGGTLAMNPTTGNLTLDGGTFRATSGIYGTATDVAVTSRGGAYDSNGTNVAYRALNTEGAFTKKGGGEFLILGTTSSINGDLKIEGGRLRVASGASLQTAGLNTHTISGTIVNDGHITYNGNTSFDAAVTGGGSTDVNGYMRILAGAGTNPFGTGALHLNGAYLSAVGSHLQIDNHTKLEGLLTLSGNMTFSGPLEMVGDVSIATINEAEFLNPETLLSGDITGGGRLSVAGGANPGELVLSGHNSYTGGTRIGGGSVLRVDSAGALGSTGLIEFAGGTLKYSAANQTDYSNRFSSAAGSVYSIDTNGQHVQFNFSLTGALNSLVKKGPGTLVLAPSSSYGGGTTLEGGTIEINNDAAFGSGAITVRNGAIRAINSPRTVGNALILDGRLESGRLTHFAGPVNLVSDSTISTNNPDGAANEDATFSGVISGAHAVSIEEGLGGVGSGAIVFSANNTYSGGTILKSGRLAISSNSNLGTGDLTFNGGKLKTSNSMDLARTVRVAAGGGLLESQGHTIGIQNLTGTGSLIQVGGGHIQIKGNSVFAGDLTIGDGTLGIDSNVTFQIGSGGTSGRLLSSVSVTGILAFDRSDASTYDHNAIGVGTLVKKGTGTLTLSGSNSLTGGYVLQEGVLSLGSIGAVNDGTIYFEGGTLQYTEAERASHAERFSLQANQQVRLDTNGQDVTISTALNSVGGSLTKIGLGTLELLAASTYTGNTTVTGGTLAAAADNRLGAASGELILDGGAFYNTSDIITARQVRLGAAGGTIRSEDGYLTLTTGLQGSGGLTKLGRSYLTLTGTQHYSGPTHVVAGIFKVDHGSLSGGPVTIDSGATVIFTGNGTLGTSTAGAGHFERAGGGTTVLTGTAAHTGGTHIADGTLQVGNGGTTGAINGAVSNEGTLAFNRSDAYTHSGVISGTGGVSQIGGGTTTLTAVNTYIGDTIVSHGTLLVNGSIARGATVQNGGHLGGHGTIGGSVTVESGGTLSPGSSPGLLTVEGNLTFQAGSTLVMEFAGITAGLYDRLDVKGTFVAGGTLNLMIIDGFNPAHGASFTIFVGPHPGFASGSFHITTNLGGGYTWDTSKLASQGIVTVVPEPGTWALVLVSLLAGLVYRCRLIPA